MVSPLFQDCHPTRRRILDAYFRPWWYKDGREDGSYSPKAPHDTPTEAFSYASFKTVHASMSEYWKDALHSHWPILIQGMFLVTAILVFGPWIGQGCSEGMIPVAKVPSDTWWTGMHRLRDLFTIKGFGIKTYDSFCKKLFRSCYEPYGERKDFKRKANILKRRRI